MQIPQKTSAHKEVTSHKISQHLKNSPNKIYQNRNANLHVSLSGNVSVRPCREPQAGAIAHAFGISQITQRKQ